MVHKVKERMDFYRVSLVYLELELFCMENNVLMLTSR
jgi:hypothetical protein